MKFQSTIFPEWTQLARFSQENCDQPTDASISPHREIYLRIRIWLLYFTVEQKNHSGPVNESNEASVRVRLFCYYTVDVFVVKRIERGRERERDGIPGKLVKIWHRLLAIYTFSDNHGSHWYHQGYVCIAVRNNLHLVSRHPLLMVITIPQRRFDSTFESTANTLSN